MNGQYYYAGGSFYPEPGSQVPETNDYVIEVRLRGIRKSEALALAETIELLAANQVPQTGVAMTVAHVKYDL